MNKEIKKDWVKALRSGKYEQGTQSLRRTTSSGDVFCCLGVLCDLYSIQKGVDWASPNLDYTSRWEFNGGISILDETGVDSWADLSRRDTTVLIGKNDNDHLSFAEIADYIEAHL